MKEADQASSTDASNSYILVELQYDDATRSLNAVLTQAEADPQVSFQSIQSNLTDQNFESFHVKTSAIEDLLRQVAKGESGVFELAKKPEYTKLDFIYDEKTRKLYGNLSATDDDPNLSWARLQELIRENQYEVFGINASVIQELMQRIKNNERGNFELGLKPEFTNYELVYDEQSRVLSANLTATEDNPITTLSMLKEEIKEENYEHYLTDDSVLDSLLQMINKNLRGNFPIGKKPEYTELTLVFDEEKNELNAILSATDDNPDLSESDINKLLELSGYDQFYFEKESVEILQANIQKNERGDFLLATKKNAELTIEIAADEMTATLSVVPAYGGKILTLSDMKAQLQKANIPETYCDREILSEVIKHQQANKQEFAHGKPPIDGEDAQFEALVKAITKRGPRIDEKDKAHLRDIKDFTIVDIGTALMKRTPATEGVAGVNVHGALLPPNPGDDVPFLLDLSGSKVSPGDKNYLLADKKGSPLVLPTGVNIDNIVKFDNIDLHSGHVTLDGSLLIEGNVRSGMVVEVTGGVIIKGAVHNATVIAGEDIVVEEGVIGSELSEEDNKSQNTARLTAGGNIHAHFVNLAILSARKDIIINEYTMHSDIEAKGQVLIGQEGGKGQMIGGRANAVAGITMNILGASSNVLTKVTVGYPLELKTEYKQLTVERTKILDKLKKAAFLLSEMDIAEDLQSQNFPDEDMEEILEPLNALVASLCDINKKLYMAQKAIKAYNKSKVTVKNQVNANTVLNINGVKLFVNEESTSEAIFGRDKDSIRRF